MDDRMDLDSDQALVKRTEALEKENKAQNTKLQALTQQVTSLQKQFQDQQAIVQRFEVEAIEEDIWSYLQTLKRNAKLKTTIKRVKANVKHKDPSMITQCLFGANEEETWRCLRWIQHRAPFSASECRDIRDVFVRTNLFMRKEMYDLGPEIPESKNPVALRTLCFNLQHTFQPTNTSRTEVLLNQHTDFKQLLLLITQIHTHKLMSHSLEGAKRQNFHDFLALLVQFIDAIDPLEYLVDNHHTRTVDDGLITIISGGSHKLRFLYEVIERVLPQQKSKYPNKIKLEYQDILGSIERLVGYMVANFCLYGILTDGETVLFITYDYNTLYDQPVYDKTLPIEIRSTHINATSPSCVETMTSWILSIQYHLTPSQMVYEVFGQKTNYPTRYALVLPTITNYFTALHDKRSPFQVFRVNVDQIQGFPHPLPPNDCVVLKIFDPFAVSAYRPLTGFSVRLEWMQEAYALERECIKRLRKDPDFNNCYYDHGEVYASVKQPDYLSSGQCLINQCISTWPLRNDEETYQNVRQQIEVLHRNKIVHKGIAPRSILCTRYNEVYLIGFVVAVLDPNPEEYLDDYRKLEELFADRNKESKEEYLN